MTTTKRRPAQRPTFQGLVRCVQGVASWPSRCARKDPRSWLQMAAAVGSGDFPLDMLRHDSAWFASEEDAGIAQRSFLAHDIWVVLLARRTERRDTAWTERRWRSFGVALVPIDESARHDVRRAVNAFLEPEPEVEPGEAVDNLEAS